MRNSDLFAVRWDFVKQAAFAWIGRLDSMKDKSPHDVVVAAGITLLLICRRFDLDPKRVLEIAGKMIANKREVDPQYVRGIDEWLKEELSDG